MQIILIDGNHPTSAPWVKSMHHTCWYLVIYKWCGSTSSPQGISCPWTRLFGTIMFINLSFSGIRFIYCGTIIFIKRYTGIELSTNLIRVILSIMKSRAKHGSDSIGLRKKFHATEPNQIEENSICCRPFSMYKLFETEANDL